MGLDARFENIKGASQPVRPRFLGGIISKLAASEFLSLALSGIPKAGFVTTRPKYD